MPGSQKNKCLHRNKCFTCIMNIEKQERHLQKEELSDKQNYVVKIKRKKVGFNTLVNNGSRYM